MTLKLVLSNAMQRLMHTGVCMILYYLMKEKNSNNFKYSFLRFYILNAYGLFLVVAIDYIISMNTYSIINGSSN